MDCIVPMVKTLIIVLLTPALFGSGQTNTHASTKLIILKPDTAIIDETPRNDIDSIEIEHLKTYYVCAKGSSAFEHDFSSSKNWTLESLVDNKSYINLPTEIRQFRFFHLISEYSKQIYEFYFSQRKLPCQIVELPSQPTDLNSLKKLVFENKADYVVFFHNIHTVMRDSLPILKVTTSLYSYSEETLVVEKETESSGTYATVSLDESNVMWRCNPHIRLECLLVNTVRASTGLVSEILPKW